MEGFVSPGGGFAARVMRRADGVVGESHRQEERARDGGLGGTGNGRMQRSSGNIAHAPSMPDAPKKKDGIRRTKRLAMVCGVSVALAFVSLAYGAWSVAASQSAVDSATAGALPTLVASADIKAGDQLSSAAVETKLIPAAYRATTALEAETLEPEVAQGEERVVDGRALVDIPAGSQITASLITGSESANHLAAELASGMEAVTVAVDTETGLSGLVKPYDTVRIVSAEGASTGASFLTTLCKRARVVAVGGTADADIASASYTSVTVEVVPEEADAVRDAQYAGHVSLVLVSSLDALEEG